MEFISGLFALSASLSSSVPASMNGVWTQPCDRGVLRVERFQDGSSRLEEHFFNDADCANPSYVFASEGQVEFESEPLPEPDYAPGARAVNFTFRKVSLVFLNESIAAWAKSVHLCGISSWASGDAGDVTGLTCSFYGSAHPVHTPAAGEGRYGIYRLITGASGTEQGLQWGMLTPLFDGRTPENRPRMWDETQIYWKGR